MVLLQEFLQVIYSLFPLNLMRPGLDQGTLSAARNFYPKFSPKSGFVRCPCAFRLRKLAKSLRRRGCSDHGPRYFSCKFSHACDMSMCISIAQARTKCRPKFWGVAFSL